MCRSKTEESDFVVVAYILVDIIMFHQFRQQTIFIFPYLEKHLTYSTTNLFSYFKDAPQSIAPYILSTTVGDLSNFTRYHYMKTVSTERLTS